MNEEFKDTCSIIGFCHNHNDLERRKKIDHDHVIIDRKDWLILRSMDLDFICCNCGLPIKKDFNFLSYQKSKNLIQHRINSNWLCDDCKKKLKI